MGDSALYSQDNLTLLREIKWLTRVPLSLSEAKNLVSSLPSSEFQPAKYLVIAGWKRKVLMGELSKDG